MDFKEEKVLKKKLIITNALKRRLKDNVYSKITVQDIADESGFSKGGVLHYFATKEDIYLDLIENIFDEFEADHSSILDWKLDPNAVAPMAAFVGTEKFILDKNNVKIIINLILYGFQEPRVMEKIRLYIKKLRLFYLNLVENDSTKTRRKSDLNPELISRIAETVVLFIGLLEAIEPIEFDHMEVVKFITTLLKG